MDKISLIVIAIIVFVAILAAILPGGEYILAQFVSNVLAVVVGLFIAVIIYITFGKGEK